MVILNQTLMSFYNILELELYIPNRIWSNLKYLLDIK